MLQREKTSRKEEHHRGQCQMETWRGRRIKWASEINNRLRINEAAELSSVSSSRASCFVHCLLCSPAHHTSPPIDAESICKSILNPEGEHFMGSVLGHWSYKSQISQIWSLMVPRWDLGILSTQAKIQRNGWYLSKWIFDVFAFSCPVALWSLFLFAEEKERLEAISACCDIL